MLLIISASLAKMTFEMLKLTNFDRLMIKL